MSAFKIEKYDFIYRESSLRYIPVKHTVITFDKYCIRLLILCQDKSKHNINVEIIAVKVKSSAFDD